MMKTNTDTFVCGIRAQQARMNNAELKVFDWIKAAEIIKGIKKDLGEEFKNVDITACLAEDSSNTFGDIIRSGIIPENEYGPYLASVWATPMFTVEHWIGDYHHCEETEYECWTYVSKTNGWDAHTFWPEEARMIFNSEE